MYATIDGIKVDTAVLRRQAGRMSVFSEQMYDVLQETKRKMNDMQRADWISRAGDAIVAKFNELEPKIAEQRETVNKFCTFLENTSQKYEEREQTRTIDASDTPTSY